GAGGTQLRTPGGEPLLIDLRIAVDPRSNSIIVAGAPSGLLRINAIIATLQDAPESEMRRNEVYHVRNSSAVDVANALTTYFGNSLNILNEGNQQTATISLEREVIIVAEPITNKLLINATPRYFEEVMRMIIELDAEQPMVVIQVLVAEVDLTSDE